MKKAFLLCGMLLALTATVANAQLNLAWDDCGLNGTTNKTFACASNAGFDMLVGSFVTPPGVTALTGQAPTVLVHFQGDQIPAWWTFGAAPNCRAATSLSSAYPGGTVPGACDNYFGDNACAGAHLPDANPAWPTQLRIRMVAAIDAGLAAPVAAGTEQYCFTLTINHARTIGTTVCGGCDVPAAFVFSSLLLSQPVGVGDFTFEADFARGDLCAAWQGGESFCAYTPAKNASWGQIKSLYR
jgi:hypothetical protein